MLGGQGLGRHEPRLFVPCSGQQPGLASEPQMAPGCGWSPSGEAGQYQVSAGFRSPDAWALGTAQQQEGACLPEAAVPGLSVAKRPAVSQSCSLCCLRHSGLGVLSQSQEMDLPWVGGGKGATAAGSWGEPQPPAYHIGVGGLTSCISP